MHLNNVRLSRIFKLCCLILICLSLTGCLSMFGPGGCGHPPWPDGPNVLKIKQREDMEYDVNRAVYDDDLACIDAAFPKRVCYDNTAIYYLRQEGEGSVVYRVTPGGDAAVFYRFDTVMEDIASWGDILLVYGKLTDKKKPPIYDDKWDDFMDHNCGVYLLSKRDPEAYPLLITGLGAWRDFQLEEETVSLRRERLPLRAIFNEANTEKPFDALWQELYPQWISAEYSKGIFDRLMQLNKPHTGSYHFPDNGRGEWLSFSNCVWTIGNYEDHIYGGGYYYMDESAWRGGYPYSPDLRANKHLVFYNGYPYLLTHDQDWRPMPSQNWELIPSVESGQQPISLAFGNDYEALLKRFFGRQGQQYFVSAAYTKEEVSGEDDRYDVWYTIGHEIIAVDLDIMQQTKELILTTPREQVLHVSEAGAYTWRHDESRIFLTNWEGQSKPVSDTIPYTPRYETDEDKGKNDACNTWYVEVDQERSRLLLFDMTLGETALLAIVPVE